MEKNIWNIIKNKPKRSSNIGYFGIRPARINTKTNISNIKNKNLTWAQAKIRYPRLKAFGDADRDGKLNMFDCRPLNKKRHGSISLLPPISFKSQASLLMRQPVVQAPMYKPIKRMSPPDEYETGEILDPYYDEYLQNQQDIEAENQSLIASQQIVQQPQPQPQPQQSTFQAIRRKIPGANSWAKPGVYNESDYLEYENPIDEYVGSGSGSAVPVRAFNPSGIKYG